MKKFLSIVLILTILINASACSWNNGETESLLISVLNSEKTFITEDGDAVLLKDYVIGEGNLSLPILAVPVEYVFVDFNDDQTNEMVINISEDYGHRLVLYVNGLDVYGYKFGFRAIQQLNTDGSFMGSNGAASAYYCKMTFENNKAKITNTAIKDTLMNRIELDGQECSIEKVDEYIKEWNFKKTVKWIKCKKATHNTQKDEANDNTSNLEKINLNNYVSVKFGGDNGTGWGSVSFDKERFLIDHMKNVSFDKDNIRAYQEIYGYTGKSAAYDIVKYISVSLDKDRNLSNGDIVKIVWKINAEKTETYFDWNYICTSESFTVVGLKGTSSSMSSKHQGNSNNNTNANANINNTTSTELKNDNIFKPSIFPQGDTDSYTITYVDVGKPHSNPTSYTVKDEITLIDPQKTGYTFLGWTYDGQETPIVNVKIPKGSKGYKTYTANWKANTYKITYDANGGSVNNKTQTAEYDSHYTLETPTRKGYTFEGWYNGNTHYYGGTWETASDFTLKAKWRINSYSVSVNCTDGGNVKGSGFYDYNSTVTVSARSLLGYTWLGWYDANDKFLSTKQSYSFTMGDDNKRLKAKWKISDDISDFKFTSTETTCTITGAVDETKSSYTIPKYVTSIDDWSFFMCDYLKAVTISNSLTNIGGHAFSGCNNLKNITLPNSISSIGESAFSGCDITSLVIPNKVTRINERAFSSCDSLTSVIIHKNVTFIGSGAFSGCTKLTSITFQGTKSQWKSMTIGDWWDHMVPATKIICSDGTISLN